MILIARDWIYGRQCISSVGRLIDSIVFLKRNSKFRWIWCSCIRTAIYGYEWVSSSCKYGNLWIHVRKQRYVDICTKQILFEVLFLSYLRVSRNELHDRKLISARKSLDKKRLFVWCFNKSLRSTTPVFYRRNLCSFRWSLRKYDEKGERENVLRFEVGPYLHTNVFVEMFSCVKWNHVLLGIGPRGKWIEIHISTYITAISMCLNILLIRYESCNTKDVYR